MYDKHFRYAKVKGFAMDIVVYEVCFTLQFIKQLMNIEIRSCLANVFVFS